MRFIEHLHCFKGEDSKHGLENLENYISAHSSVQRCSQFDYAGSASCLQVQILIWIWFSILIGDFTSKNIINKMFNCDALIKKKKKSRVVFAEDRSEKMPRRKTGKGTTTRWRRML